MDTSGAKYSITAISIPFIGRGSVVFFDTSIEKGTGTL
jgi:hypothetical protein